MKRNVEIFHGDIGSVRNDLNAHINEEVEEILSITQSVSTTGYNTTAMLTVIMVYIPKNSKVEKENKPKEKAEEYI
jgi:hypothetical protein